MSTILQNKIQRLVFSHQTDTPVYV